MKQSFISIILVFTFISKIWAVTAYPGLITVTQPNGEKIAIRIHGNEFASYTTTSDGFLIRQNPKGYYVYEKIEDGNPVLSNITAKNIQNRSKNEIAELKDFQPTAKLMIQKQKIIAKAQHISNYSEISSQSSYPLSGNPNSLVILVNFSDNAFTVSNPQQAFTNLLNAHNYSDNNGTGSARDYFMACSDSAFQPQFTVVGPYTLPHDMAYYGQPSGSNNDANPQQMIIDACTLAYKDGVNFANFDTNGDGICDNVFVYYAGYNEAEGGGDNTIWPHRSYTSAKFGGTSIYNYACTSELKGSSGNTMCGIGTFCHEFGHVLGLPDFYPTNGGNWNPLGSWDIMDYGNYNNAGCTPPVYSSLERYFLGWLSPDTITSGSHVLQPLETTNKAYIVAASTPNFDGSNPTPREFFMVENRQHVGWDSISSAIPAYGILVTHINFSPTAWDLSSNSVNNIENNLGVTIQAAAGTIGSGQETYPGISNITQCYFSLKDGTTFPTPLTNIRQITDNNVSFLYSRGGEGYPTIKLINDIKNFYTPYGMSPDTQTVEIVGSKISSLVIAKITNGTNFRMRFHNSSDDFGTSLTINPNTTDSTFDKFIDIIFDPTRVYYQDATDNLDIINSEFELNTPLNGYAPLPQYITRPKADSAVCITPYSYTAVWNQVMSNTNKASYYLTQWHLKDTEWNDIANFDNSDSIIPFGWTSTFTTTSTVFKNTNPQSLYFTESSDTLTTETYYMPINNISFWIRGYSTTGTFKVEGFNGISWTTIDTTEINGNLPAKTFSYNLYPSDSIIRLRMTYKWLSGSGGLAFDDFTINLPKQRIYNLFQQYIFEDTTYLISNLDPNTTYFYAVQATDINDLNRKIANITDFSDTIATITLNESTNSKFLTYSTNSDNSNYIVYVNKFDNNSRLFIYNLSGMLIKQIKVTSNTIKLPQLPGGQFYILKYMNNDTTVPGKGKYLKFYYAL